MPDRAANLKSQVEEGFRLLVPAGAVVELRALGTPQAVISGYFNDLDQLVRGAARLSGKAEGVYITANPVKRDLLARAANRTKSFVKTTTGDEDIERRSDSSSTSTPSAPRVSARPRRSTVPPWRVPKKSSPGWSALGGLTPS
jgi:hypothetical protein